MKKLFLLLVPILILLSGCGEDPDCSENNTDYVTYKYDAESESCVVASTVQKDVCGNSIIEEGENYCNCAKDVSVSHPILGCEGSVGDYVEKVCRSEVCVYDVNSKVVSQTKIIDFQGEGIGFKGEIKLGNPLVFNTYTPSTIELTIEPSFIAESDTYKLKNIKVNSLEILDESQTKLADINYGEIIEGFDTSITKKFELEPINRYNQEVTLIMYFSVTYDAEIYDGIGTLVRTDTKRETVSGGLGWSAINPDFYE